MMQTAVAPKVKMSKEIKAHKLFTEINNIRSGMSNAKDGMLIAGKALLTIYNEKLWKVDSTPAKSFVHWVENELGISKSTAYNLIDAYKKVGMIIEGNPDYKAIDMSKVFLLLPYMKEDITEEKKEEMLHMAMNTTWQGLKDNLREASGKIATDACSHEDTELVERCKKCNKWLKK